jgi:hypothetical protein
MGINPLDPASTAGRPDRDVRRGHGTRELGPSDSSDTGSDLTGARGLAGDVDGFGVESGNVNDTEKSAAGNTAGPDVGDANLDSDSDRSGTGERAAASRDSIAGDGADIDTDHIETLADGLDEDNTDKPADVDEEGDADEDENEEKE